MGGARAVVPEGLRGVGDLNLEGRAGGTLLDGDESRPETILHGLARSGKGRLGNRVALGPELESDGIALSSGDVGGLESQATLSGHDDVVSSESGASNGRGSNGEGRETHYDWLCGRETSSIE